MTGPMDSGRMNAHTVLYCTLHSDHLATEHTSQWQTRTNVIANILHLLYTRPTKTNITIHMPTHAHTNAHKHTHTHALDKRYWNVRIDPIFN